jgi:hypothetical protein
MENFVIFNHDFPEAYELIGLVIFFMDCLERPVNPARSCSGFGIPVGNQDIQGLLDQGADFVISLRERLEAADEGEVEAEGFIRVESLEGTDVIAGPNKGIVLDNFILHSE